ncbi:FkbM family methyltransferase [Alteraurantiacibacter aquimixticola]|uniref:FkbM family methyltransferase n=1 Tax=Alteraurantiacibacter aquimixticola TaxID=2489173 RepID=UPI00145AC151|nr:FkbM family methyltransferase [Alteraurantiacibacter aquimixticola]
MKNAVELRQYGQGHAAWWVPADLAAGSVAYCGGVGLDATFDFALADEMGLEVHSFDPTPRALEYMERENRGRVRMHPWGLLDRDEVVRFHAPADPRHVNFFVENLHGTEEYFEAECLTISTVMERLGHERIDLLKIDIEGSWGKVIDRMLDDSILPGTLCVEFDSPAPLWRVRPIVRRLQKAGYSLVRRDKENCVFVHTR